MVTSLEPRTPHQSAKLRRCQRTSMVLLLLFLQSIETMRFYLLSNQWSAVPPQGYDTFWCKCPLGFCRASNQGASLGKRRKLVSARATALGAETRCGNHGLVQ